MRVTSGRVKELRAGKHWSQEELAVACGINLRTIQRIENQGSGSLESVKALAAVFGIDADDLLLHTAQQKNAPLAVVKTCLVRYAEFSGTAGRAEYWWFLLFVLLTTAMAAVIHHVLGRVVFLAELLPLLAVGTRRLRDAGHGGGWQLLFLVPFGFVVVFWLLAKQGENAGPRLEPA